MMEKFFIVFNEENEILKICKIKEQFLSHSFELIKESFLKGFEELKEAQNFFNRFILKVGSSNEMFFLVEKRTEEEQRKYIEDLIKLRKKYLNKLKGGLKWKD